MYLIYKKDTSNGMARKEPNGDVTMVKDIIIITSPEQSPARSIPDFFVKNRAKNIKFNDKLYIENGAVLPSAIEAGTVNFPPPTAGKMLVRELPLRELFINRYIDDRDATIIDENEMVARSIQNGWIPFTPVMKELIERILSFQSIEMEEWEKMSWEEWKYYYRDRAHSPGDICKMYQGDCGCPDDAEKIDVYNSIPSCLKKYDNLKSLQITTPVKGTKPEFKFEEVALPTVTEVIFNNEENPLFGKNKKNTMIRVPSHLNHLPNLEFLEIKNYYIQDPEIDPETVPRLKKLNLQDNLVRNIDGLRGISSLEHLNVGLAGIMRDETDKSNNLYVIEDIDAVKEMHGLKILDIYGHDVKQIPYTVIGKLKHLEELNAGYNKLKRFPPITRLNYLKKLNVSKNQIQSIPKRYKSDSIEELDVSENVISSIRSIHNFPALKILDISDNLYKHSDNGDAIYMKEPLQNLEKLNASFASTFDINAAIFSGRFCNKNKLKVLDISSTFLPNPIIHEKEELVSFEGFDSLKELNMSYNRIEDMNQLKGLNSLAKLEILDLNNNKIKKIENLSNLHELTKLYLNENNITMLNGIGGLKNLKELWLGSNDITAINTDEINSLDKVWFLDLRKNELSYFPDFSGMKSLGLLFISENNIDKSKFDESKVPPGAIVDSFKK